MTNKIIISTLVSFLLVNTLSAKNILKEYQCGQNFESQNIDKYNCKTVQIPQSIVKNISKIKSYKDLYQKIGIDTSWELYKSKKSQKLLNDIFFNDYTLTYLIYKKVVNFTEILDEDLQEQNSTKNNFIKKINLGGEFIALIHIKTNSNDDYKKISKKITKKVLSYSDINTFQKIVSEIEKTHEIKIKNFISENNSITPSNDLNTVFSNAKNFEKTIKGESEPLKLYLYHDNKKSISNILDYYYHKNNLYYIKTHPKQFIKNKTLHQHAKEYDKIAQALTYQKRKNIVDQNITIDKTILLKRYDASLDIQPIIIPPFSYKIKKENIHVNYLRVDKNIKFKLLLKLREEIKRKGKVIIETIKIDIKENNHQIAKEENSLIRLDTFVNYPKLVFSKIDNNSIGSIEEEFIFDRYEQDKKIKGIGLIKEATCGYKVDTTNQIHFGCTEIKLKALDIRFKHHQ